MFKIATVSPAPSILEPLFPQQHPERSPVVPAVTSLSGALLLPQLSSPKDGGAILSGQDHPPTHLVGRGTWAGRARERPGSLLRVV